MSEGKQTEQLAELKKYVGGVEQRLERRIGAVEESLSNRVGAVEERIGAVEVRLGEVQERLGRVEEKLDKQSDDFHRFIGIVEDVYQHKINLILDGIQMLTEQKEHTDSRVDGVEHRVDSLEVGFAAHRADPDAHRTGYRVREE